MSINFFGTGVVVHRTKLQKLLCPTIDYPWEMKKEENKICLKWILKLLHSCGRRRTVMRGGVFLTKSRVYSNITILEFSRTNWGTREGRRGTRVRQGNIPRQSLDHSVLRVQLFQKLRYSGGEQWARFLNINSIKTSLSCCDRHVPKMEMTR